MQRVDSDKMFRLGIVFLVLSSALAEKDPVVELEDGTVEGYYQTSYNGRKFAAFEGIPFAAPPIQKYRFRDPQPVAKWNGTLKANLVYSCLQYLTTEVLGTEDCLYVNVYVPRENIKAEENLDVVVHIHGGAFMMGAGHMAGPAKIMDRDLVYVNFNYRLGPFGFLATEDDVFHGNYGLKDQRQALRWVKNNIAKFGGNPDSVTIIGLSAGGASVHLHYFTWNTDEKLFHRGWAQSGAAFNPWAVKTNAWPAAKKLIATLGCTDESIKVTLRCMRQRPGLQIVQALKGNYEGYLLPLAPFSPAPELMSVNNQYPFLIAHPYVQLKSKHVLDVPLILSMTSDEGLLPAGMHYNTLNEVNKNWKKWAPLMLEYYTESEEKQDEVSQKIKEFYLKGENITQENFKAFVKVCSQRLFHMGAEKSMKMQANISTSNNYFMIFGYPGTSNVFKTFYNADVEGVGHSSDAKFLYDVKFGGIDMSTLSEEEEKMKEVMLDFLESFAKTGIPTSKSIQWDPMEKEGNLKYLSIKSLDDMQMKTTKRLGAYEFWRSLELREEEHVYHFTEAGIEIK